MTHKKFLLWNVKLRDGEEVKNTLEINMKNVVISCGGRVGSFGLNNERFQ